MSATTNRLMNRSEIAALYARYGLPVIGGGEPTPEELAEAEAEAKRLADEEAEKLKLGDAGKAALADERKAKRDAITALKTAQAELDALKAKQAESDAAKAKADEAEAIKRGEFEALATSRAETITTLTGERDGYKTQLDTLIASLKPGIDAAWKDLPEEVAELFTGDAEDTLAKQAFMASHKKLIDRLTAQQEQQNKALTGFPKTPKPNGGQGDDAEARKSQASLYRTF